MRVKIFYKALIINERCAPVKVLGVKRLGDFICALIAANLVTIENGKPHCMAICSEFARQSGLQ